jgi:hypothetical protein
MEFVVRLPSAVSELRPAALPARAAPPNGSAVQEYLPVDGALGLRDLTGSFSNTNLAWIPYYSNKETSIKHNENDFKEPESLYGCALRGFGGTWRWRRVPPASAKPQSFQQPTQFASDDSPQAVSGPRFFSLGVRVVGDVLNGVSDTENLLRGRIGNFNRKLILECHNELHSIQRV